MSVSQPAYKGCTWAFFRTGVQHADMLPQTHLDVCRRQTQSSQLRRSFSRSRPSRIQKASQSFTEQHKRLSQQHQQAEVDAAANKAQPARALHPQALASVVEDTDAETTADTPPAPARQQTPTGTYTGTSAAPINVPAGLHRESGSGKRLSPKPMHYGMSEHSSPLPVLHSPFASAPAAQKADVLDSVDANLLTLQQKL